MDRNYSLYSGIRNFKYGISALALSALLGASTTGCMSQQSGMPTVYRIQKSELTEEQYLGLSGTHRRQLDERGYTYLSKNYVKQNVKPSAKQKTIDEKVQEKPASQKVETERSWFDRNKGWVIPVAIVGAAAAGYGIAKAVDKNDSKKHDHKYTPKKGGSNPNVGPDQGDGSDSDKDSGSSSDSGSGSDSNKDSGNF